MSENGKSIMHSRTIEFAKRTGIDIVQGGGAVAWAGPYGGNVKPKGPLAGKKIGVVVASEFSDFQAYYLVSYIGEYGGLCEFLLVDWVTWKFTRPNIATKGVRGMWDLSVDPIPVMGGNKAELFKGLQDAKAEDYDALIILGGHSADVMLTEAQVMEFIKKAADKGAYIGGIAAGIMPMISAGIMNEKKCTGDRTVDYMLKKIARFESASVVVDGNIITVKSTIDTPVFLRALCKAIEPGFDDPWRDSLAGKRVLFMVGGDFEDIELVVPTMEFIYRGAQVVIGKFPPEMTARPPLVGLDVIMGNFGVSIPFQEIPDCYYSIKDLTEIKISEFDVAVITGAFNPWNIVATGHTDWLKEVHGAGKLIAAICHGAIPLAAADLINGKKVTGWLACKDSVEIMGGEFKPEDWAAAIHGKIITGRTPPEIPEFIDAISVALLI
jgi:protease I